MNSSHLIDAHAHVIPNIGIQHVVALSGTTHNDSFSHASLYLSQPNVRLGYGLHPWFIEDHNEENICQPIDIHSFHFIGEIGLDRGKRGKNFDKQCRIVRRGSTTTKIEEAMK